MQPISLYLSRICLFFLFFAAIFTQNFAKPTDIPLKIMVNAGADLGLCQGDSVQLNASGAISYSWTPSTGLSNPAIANPLAFPATTTTYILFGTDAGGIISRDTIVITVHALPIVNAGIDTILCEGAATVQLFAASTVPANAYSWYPSTGLNASNIQNPSATPDTTTLYTVMLTDINGCIGFGDRNVTVLPNKTSSIGDTSVCVSDTLQLYAGGGISYSWHPGMDLINPSDSLSITASMIVSTTTILNLVVIDSFGCVIDKNITITAKPLPIVNAGIDSIMLCRDSVLLVAICNSSSVKYLWSPGEFTDDATAAITWGRPWYTGNFTVMVTDTLTGCKNYDSRYITLSDHFLTVDIVTHDTILCPGASLPLLATTSHPVVLYIWDSPSGNYNDIYINNPVFTPYSPTFAHIIVKDSLECKDADQINVNIDYFRVQTIPDSNICFGTTIILGTNGGAIFSWSPNIGIDNPTSPAPIANPSATTTYFVETIDMYGCYSYDTVTVTVFPTPVANAGNDRELCEGDSIQLQGYGGGSYEWTPATGLSNAYIGNPKAAPAVATSYIVTVRNQYGCADQDLMRVEVRPMPIISYGTDAAICQEDTVPLFATGTLNYAWSPLTGLSSSSSPTPNAYPLQTTTYRVIGSTEYGCTDTGFITINVTEKPNVNIVGYPGICEGQNIILSVDNASNYSWSTGTTGSSITVSPPISSWFSCQGFNGICGGKIDSFYVEVWQNPIADFGFTQFTQYAPIPISFVNGSQLASTYTWDFGMNEALEYEENPVHNFPFAGDFIVTMIAETSNGCKDTLSKPISLINANLYVPSAFSPNVEFDNVNNTFKVGGYGLLKFHIKIESRIGQLVYESEDMNFEWDGKIKGQPAPEGVYFYKIEAMAESGKKFQKVGTVTLIR